MNEIRHEDILKIIERELNNLEREILENKTTLDQDIKWLKDKYPDLRFTITVEDNL